VIIYGINGSVLYSAFFDFEEGTEQVVPTDLLSEIQNLGVPANQSSEFHINGLITTSLGVVAAVSAPITKSDGTFTQMGNLVYGRLIDAEQVTYLSEIVGLDFTLSPNDESLSTSDLLVEQIGNNQLLVKSVIHDLSDNQDVIIEVIISSDYRSVISLALANTIWALLIMNILMIVFIAILMNRQIISRLEHLSGGISGLSTRRGFDQRLVVDGKGDEISLISNRINEMLNELENAHEAIKKMAHHDALTMLPNRFSFNEILDRAIDNASETNTNLAVLFVDVDYFKAINDQYGHDIGDEFIIKISQRMTALLSHNDLIARIGGDEFLVLSSNATKTSVNELANRLAAISEEQFVVNGIERNISICIGVAFYPEDGVTRSELITNSDAAMYQAKETGRNNICYYERVDKQK
jgi:diguanylate cyclase (GGDEF)-like protein